MSGNWNQGRIGEQASSFDRVCCRHSGAGSRFGGSWTLREEPPKYAPDRTCDLEHLKLEINPDLPKRSISATAILTLRAAYGPFRSISLDAVELEIQSVKNAKGKSLDYTYLDEQLVVRFPREITSSETLVVQYKKRHPVRGLYFWGPTDHAPKANWQLWSQGEDEEARHWIPCHDAPNEKMTTEMVVTVPGEFTVVSNGALKSVRTSGKKKVWHFYESVPHSSYLISLVVGVFSKLEDECDGLPVEYFVEPGREEEGWRSFGKTPEMIEYFSELLQCPYPYEKYAQVAVRNFVAGGMENTSATTQTDGTLCDERAGLDNTSDDLVSHELAHQWFGDLITCKHWAHAWLNEGFATYLEAIWKEKAESSSEFEMNMIENAESYLAEPYRRPIVSHRYAHPFQLFDMHLYPKAAWVLHMLRRRLGDDLFWKAVRLYLRRHAAGTAETIDLIRAMEDASGKSLEGFFEQWIYSPGHPELEGSLHWDEGDKTLEIELRQSQSLDGGVPVFKIPIEIEAKLDSAGKDTVSKVFLMDDKSKTFYLRLKKKPISVVFDPNALVLATFKMKMPRPWIESALLGRGRDKRVYARFALVSQLAHDAGLKSTEILGEVLRKDPFWGVQAQAARVLGRIRSPQALQELLDSMSISNPKARRAVMVALGNFRGATAVRALKQAVRKKDPSYMVDREIRAAFGRVGGAEATEILRKDLEASLRRRDWHDVVAVGSIIGLAATRDESVVDALLEVADDQSRYWSARMLAMISAAELGAARPAVAPKISERVSRHLDDPDLLIASRVPDALADLRYPGAIPALRAKAATTPLAEIRVPCLAAATRLAKVDGPGGESDRLRDEIGRLTDESRRLRDRLDRVEGRDANAGHKPNSRSRRQRSGE